MLRSTQTKIILYSDFLVAVLAFIVFFTGPLDPGTCLGVIAICIIFALLLIRTQRKERIEEEKEGNLLPVSRLSSAATVFMTLFLLLGFVLGTAFVTANLVLYLDSRLDLGMAAGIIAILAIATLMSFLCLVNLRDFLPKR